VAAVERKSAVVYRHGSGHIDVACLTASAESAAALRKVEARDCKHGPIKLKGCRVLGVEVKTVDVAIAAKIAAGTATQADRVAAAKKLLDDHKAQAIAEVRRFLDDPQSCWLMPTDPGSDNAVFYGVVTACRPFCPSALCGSINYSRPGCGPGCALVKSRRSSARPLVG
jgi:hypothetical protein